jgi:hypothetical protein
MTFELVMGLLEGTKSEVEDVSYKLRGDVDDDILRIDE